MHVASPSSLATQGSARRQSLRASSLGSEVRRAVLVAHGQCVEHRGAGEPYLPVLEALGRLARQPSGRPLVPLLARQAPTWVAQMPWLLSDDELETVQRRLIGATHERMLREMLETLEAISREFTLVLVLEDLHWSDPSTVDLLDALARRREPARLLVVGTYRRSDAVAQDHPVHRLARELRGRGLCTEIAVGPLSRDAVADYVDGTARLGRVARVSAVLRERTGGNPLFVTIAARLVARARAAASRESRPRASRERRTGHGPRADRTDARAARPCRPRAPRSGERDRTGVLGRRRRGRESTRSEDDVDARCDALARAGRFIEQAGEELWPDGTLAARYRFAHDLHREVALRFASRPANAQRSTGESASGWRPPTEIDRGRSRQSSPSTSCAQETPRVPCRRFASRPSRRSSGSPIGRPSTTSPPRLAMLDRVPEGPDRWSEELALQSMLGAALDRDAGLVRGGSRDRVPSRTRAGRAAR